MIIPPNQYETLFALTTIIDVNFFFFFLSFTMCEIKFIYNIFLVTIKFGHVKH